MSGVPVEGELKDWGDGCSVNGENVERLLFELSPTSSFNILQPPPKRPTFSIGGGWYLGEKTSFQETFEYLESGNQVSPKSSQLQAPAVFLRSGCDKYQLPTL